MVTITSIYINPIIRFNHDKTFNTLTGRRYISWWKCNECTLSKTQNFINPIKFHLLTWASNSQIYDKFSRIISSRLSLQKNVNTLNQKTCAQYWNKTKRAHYICPAEGGWAGKNWGRWWQTQDTGEGSHHVQKYMTLTFVFVFGRPPSHSSVLDL